jgi:hypothetical protein
MNLIKDTYVIQEPMLLRIISLTLVCLPLGAVGTGSLCLADEETIFHCNKNMRRKVSASLCGVKKSGKIAELLLRMNDRGQLLTIPNNASPQDRSPSAFRFIDSKKIIWQGKNQYLIFADALDEQHPGFGGVMIFYRDFPRGIECTEKPEVNFHKIQELVLPATAEEKLNAGFDSK